MTYTEKGKPIYDAICKDDIDKVRELLINPSNVDINMALDENGYTALHEACYYGRVEIVQLLLDHGANSHQTGKYGGTALTCACQSGKLEIVELLLNHGANVNHGSRTALHAASFKAIPRMVKLLLQRGAHVNQQVNDYVRNTPLHEVGIEWYGDETHDKIEVVKELLLYGANPTIQNEHRKTPMDWAKERDGDKSIGLKMMIDHWKKPERERKELLELHKREQLQIEQEQKFYRLVLRPFQNNNDLRVVIRDDIINSIFNLTHLKIFYTWIRRLQLLQEIRHDEARNFITTAMERCVPKVTNEFAFVVFEMILLKALQDKLITMQTKIVLNRRAENMETSNSKFVNDIRMDIYKLQQHVNYLEKRTDRLDQAVDDVDHKIASMGESVQKVQKALKKKARVEAATGYVACVLNLATWGFLGTALQGVMSQLMNHIVDFGDIVHIESIVNNIPNNEILKEAIQTGVEAAEDAGKTNSFQDMANWALETLTGHYDDKADKEISQAIAKVAKWGSHKTNKKKSLDGGASLSALVFVAKMMQVGTTAQTNSLATTAMDRNAVLGTTTLSSAGPDTEEEYSCCVCFKICMISCMVGYIFSLIGAFLTVPEIEL